MIVNFVYKHSPSDILKECEIIGQRALIRSGERCVDIKRKNNLLYYIKKAISNIFLFSK